MKRFLFPLLLMALGVYGIVDHEAINEQWAAMYPENPARQTALARCAQEDGLFNRFSEAARAACYQKFLQVDLPFTPPPGMAVQIPGAPPTHMVPRPPTVHTNH